MSKFQDILPAGQRIVKSPSVVSNLLAILTSHGVTDRGDGFSESPSSTLQGPVSAAALACLSRIAGCADLERRSVLRDALSDDGGSWEMIAPALLGELCSRPLRPKLASDATLLLWVSVDDDDSKKDKLLMRHKVRSLFPKGPNFQLHKLPYTFFSEGD